MSRSTVCHFVNYNSPLYLSAMDTTDKASINKGEAMATWYSLVALPTSIKTGAAEKLVHHIKIRLP